jgi:tetratricopeptide (TPR) repeat protein
LEFAKGDLMRVRSKAILAVVAALAIASGACGKVGNLQARKAFKEATTMYTAQNYQEAADKYQEVLASDPNFTTTDGTTPYFYIANSYDNLYKPARKGEAANDAFLTKAIENYKIAAEKDTNPKMRNLALDYLVYAYGPEKLNDPTQAEPIVQKKISLDPSEATNYFMLAKIYEDNGNLDQAETMYKKAQEMKPKDAAVYQQLAGYYQRQGEFDKLIEAVQQRAELEPNNPEAHYSIASYYWDEAYRNSRLSEAQKKEYTDKGLDEVDKALKIKADYVEAVVYKGLLLRIKATLTKDLKEQQQLLKQASDLQAEAAAMKKKQTEGK